MVVGTTQFGMPYGILNQNGQMNFSDISMILYLAWGNGINSLYTAKAYGESEGSIGKYLKHSLGFEPIKKVGWFCRK
jgi:aryl-alcohol dehydrogenase-like predicted oxidoreductase